MPAETEADFINEWVNRDPTASGDTLGSIGLLHRVPSGAFYFGSRFHPREAPRREITLGEYEIAHAPVMVKQFAAFVDAGGYQQERWWTEAGWAWRQGASLGWGRVDRSRPEDWANQKTRSDHPIVGVCLHEAEAYCLWLSAQKNRVIRLPSEEEWEKAARGDDGRPWPWGEAFQSAQANTLEINVGNTTSVGNMTGDVSPCGALDMAGNAQEWTRSLYTPLADEVFTSDEALYTARGGSFNDTAYGARASYRRGYPAGYFYPFLGFRIVVAHK
jgi:formylglycine-generating enzyme required for sulfatase activity